MPRRYNILDALDSNNNITFSQGLCNIKHNIYPFADCISKRSFKFIIYYSYRDGVSDAHYDDYYYPDNNYYSSSNGQDITLFHNKVTILGRRTSGF